MFNTIQYSDKLSDPDISIKAHLLKADVIVCFGTVLAPLKMSYQDPLDMKFNVERTSDVIRSMTD